MEMELLAFGCGLFQAPRRFFVGGDGDEMIQVPVPAWLVRHPVKGMAVFDTGLDHRFVRETDLPADAVDFDFRAGEDMPARMQAAGFDPAAVNWVINSHLHADHCGGNKGFPNATVVVQRREWDAARRNENGRSYNPADFDLGQPRLEIEGEHDLFGDGTLVLFPTYGHTPGHQSARVRLPGGEVVLTADCCYWEEGLDALVVPGINLDREASLGVLKHLQAMRASGIKLLFGHDPVQWQSIRKGEPIRFGAGGLGR